MGFVSFVQDDEKGITITYYFDIYGDLIRIEER